MSPDLERLIGRAVVDKKFRKQLLKDPDKAIADAGFSLTAEELAQVKDAAANRGKDEKKVDDDLELARRSAWK
jgi:Ribosomally synthesized peptide prototyped by Frankia Franean1_4349.